MVRGAYQMKPMMRISRNMVVIRHGQTLSLINPIRLTAVGEQTLDELGKVEHLIRLGAFHGVDDPYYVDRYGAKFWCQRNGRTYPEPKIDYELTQEATLPFSDAQIVPFLGTREPECALLLKRGRGLLLTCDAIQHYGDYKHNSLLARIIMPFIGFPKTTLVGPIWLKVMTRDPQALRPSFEALLQLEFDSLISAHGSYLSSGAKAAVETAVHKAFSQKK